MNEGDLKYFLVKILTIVIDSESGRTRNNKEEKLVNAYTVSDAETRVYAKYEGNVTDMRIVSVVESKINEVI